MGYIGLRLGLSSELVKLTGVIGGFFVSYRYYQGFGDFLVQKTFLRIEWAAALAMVFLVMAVYLALAKGLRLLEKLVQVTFQAKLNKAGGLAAGLVRALLISSLILVVCRQLPSPYLNDSIEERSLSGRLVSRMAPAVYDAVSPLCARLVGMLRVRP